MTVLLILLLALAFGSPNMEFPWWVWVLTILGSVGQIVLSLTKLLAELD